jgi:hypothetical protein
MLPNHVRAIGERIGCKCPIVENERDREHDSQHDSRQHRFHWKSSSLCPAHFLRESMSKMRHFHRAICRAYTPGALFYAKVKIVRYRARLAVACRALTV